MSALDDRHDALLDEVLRHVPFDGWSAKSLDAARIALDLDALTLHRAFPNGIADAVREFSDRADREMLRSVAALARDVRTRDRIAAAVRARLEALTPHREAARRLVAWCALPGHQPIAARLLYRTVDSIWYAAGDRSTDFGFYTKRALLGGVYGATLLYWLEDRSPGAEETWRFLDRRIDDVMRLPRLGDRASRFLRGLRPSARRPI